MDDELPGDWHWMSPDEQLAYTTARYVPAGPCEARDGTGLVEDPSACGDPEHCYGWMPCPRGCPEKA